MGDKAERAEQRSGLSFKEERFCQLYVKYAQDAKRAVLEAGLADGKEKDFGKIAVALMKDDRIQRRIGDLQEHLALRNNLTPDKVVEMILSVYKAAFDGGKFDQANKAAELLGKYLGMFVDKSETKQLVVTDEAKLDQDIQRFAKIAGIKIEGHA